MNEKRRPQSRDNEKRRADRFADRTPVEEVEGQLEGRNALTEALKSGRTIDKVFVAMGDTDKGLQRLAAQAKEAGAVVVPVDRRKLDVHDPFPSGHHRTGSCPCVLYHRRYSGRSRIPGRDPSDRHLR